MHLDPVKAFLRTLCIYMRDRGHMLLSLTSVSGQREVKIALRALWRRHDAEETGYLRFEDVIADLEGEEERVKELRRIGFKGLVEVEGEKYLVFDLDTLKRVVESVCREVLG